MYTLLGTPENYCRCARCGLGTNCGVRDADDTFVYCVCGRAEIVIMRRLYS